MRSAVLKASLLYAALSVGVVLAAENQPAIPPGDPPPLGTSSFVPPASIDEQPLTAASFVTRAGITNLMEIEASSLAQTKASNPSVKAFAVQLIADHRAAQSQLKGPAAQAKLALPGEIDVQHQQIRHELAELDGAAFDAKFIEVMSKSHEDAVRMFEDAAKNPKLTPELQSYARAMLPKLQSHAQMAHKLSASH